MYFLILITVIEPTAVHTSCVCEVFQSAYPANHSTETALIRVYNDIVLSIDSHKSVVLVLLDLSAAFHTVDIFSCSQGYQPALAFDALNWFYSYLSNRTQFVTIQGVSSHVNDY